MDSCGEYFLFYGLTDFMLFLIDPYFLFYGLTDFMLFLIDPFF